MSKKKCFCVVGYRNWGKSRTLSLCFGKNSKIVNISDIWFELKRQSNSDIGEKFLFYLLRKSNSDIGGKELKKRITEKIQHNLIVAFNPDYDDGWFCVNECLEVLKNWEVYFFILKNHWKDSKRVKRKCIEEKHIENLKKVSNNFFLCESRDQQERKEEFLKYIKENI